MVESKHQWKAWLYLAPAIVLLLVLPTFHLDMESFQAVIKGLEAFLCVVLQASHDHELLTSTCNRVIAFQPDGTIIRSTEMLEAFEEPVERILEAVHGVLERTPPELVADISNNGIVMTGGGSLVDGFDRLIEARTGIHTVVAESAISCVAEGTGKSLDSLNAMTDGTVNLSRRRQMN